MSKPYRSNCGFRLGLLTILADLLPVKVPGAGEGLFKSVCPDCPKPIKPTQQYVCPVGHGPFSQGQLGKAREVSKDNLVKITDEERATINGTFPTRIFEMKVCPVEDFVCKTLPGSSAYRIKPNSKTPDETGYQLLKSLVENPNHVFYGRMKMDDAAVPGAFRLTVWNGQLLLQSIIPPSSLEETDKIGGEADPKYIEMAQTLVSQMEAPFDGEYLRDERVDRINEILAAKEAGQEVPVVKETQSSIDLVSALEASLKATAK